ncbi:hypothetical protein CLAIMM_09649 isoform 2, partial [Cladophialophora immunda]
SSDFLRLLQASHFIFASANTPLDQVTVGIASTCRESGLSWAHRLKSLPTKDTKRAKPESVVGLTFLEHFPLRTDHLIALEPSLPSWPTPQCGIVEMRAHHTSPSFQRRTQA